MFITRLQLHNWRNFRDVNLPLQRRVFIVGANATGKSNLLDALRFLRDIAKPDGGLHYALNSRGDFKEIRSLFARGSDNQLQVEIELSQNPADEGVADWMYSLRLRQEPRGSHRVLIAHERAERKGQVILNRPDADDEIDDARLTQTALEQLTANREFRPIAEFLATIRYLHLVPQMLRYAQEMQAKPLPDDPFGQGLIEHIIRTPKRTREARLRRIERSLRLIAPQFSELRAVRDEVSGRPHLEARFEHWRARGAWQRDDALSDGMLRLIALLWTAQEPGGPLLLEEPELSLHDAVVRQLAGAFAGVAYGWRSAGWRNARQVWLTTHAAPLLHDDGISLTEIVRLHQDASGTRAQLASDDPQLLAMYEQDIPIGDDILVGVGPWVDASAPQLTFLSK